MLGQLLKTIFNLFCGSPSTRPDAIHQPGPSTQQYPPQAHHHPAHVPAPANVVKPPQGQHKPSRPPKKNQDPNQINQTNEYYVSLRARANEHGDQIAKCFQESHEAYARGDGALAKELSNKGKENQRKMEQLNEEASDFIFVENNKNSKPGEIDLHGLYVKEAIARTDQAIKDARDRGDSQVNLIVGKGLHSTGGIAKIKPAIEDLMRKHQLKADMDPNNAGVLIVFLDPSRTQRGIGAEEIFRRLERNDESCTIM